MERPTKEMKRFISLILIIFLLFQLGSTALMNVWFHFSNNSFEKLFCVNIDAPEKKCHGSCMMKKINLAPEEKDDVSKSVFFLHLELAEFMIPENCNFSLKTSELIKGQPCMYLFNYYFDGLFPIFHPPETIFPSV